MEYLLTGVIVILSIGVLWVAPIWLGIRAAKRKGRATTWMWFGVHPMTGWIAYAVINSLPPLKECSQCAEKVKAHAKICPYCMTPFPPNHHMSSDVAASGHAGYPDR